MMRILIKVLSANIKIKDNFLYCGGVYFMEVHVNQKTGDSLKFRVSLPRYLYVSVNLDLVF